jgi:indole-3-glycerol phosphate synthase
MRNRRRHNSEEPIFFYLSSTSSDTTDASSLLLPQAFASGYSTHPNLQIALQEAAAMAVSQLPADAVAIDLAVFTLSSLYESSRDSTVPATAVVPALLAALHPRILHHAMGGYAAGAIASSGSAPPVELERVPAVSITLALLPETTVRAFHVADVPDVGAEPGAWSRLVGLNPTDHDAPPPIFWLLPSPAFGTELDALLQGLVQNFRPGTQLLGGVASTVSSLSRARLYCYNRGSETSTSCFGDGCVGVALQGDLQLRSWMAHGAKPVGGIYQILKGQASTIHMIVRDETATAALPATEVSENDDAEPGDARAMLARVYAQAPIPKPVLAEANFLLRTLSDDDQAFMRRQLLVGLDAGGPLGRTASELARLAAGQGHRFTVRPVAAGGMKDGSVTLALGSVRVQPGTRLRFFVRAPDFARQEVTALWTGYQRRRLTEQFAKETTTFTPAGCFLVPTLDRGSKFFTGKPGYESQTAASMLPYGTCISGFFANGVVGPLDGSTTMGVQGSASGYFLLGPRSGRPVYSPVAATRAAPQPTTPPRGKVPRSEDGELLWKRREVHAGRALTVSTVEWSVVEKTAQPSSVLEGYMWDKETEVDRLRERVPLSQLASQCRADNPAIYQPRDWLGPVRQARTKSGFLLLPECKRSDPAYGTLRRRYDVAALARDWAGAPALVVHSDGLLFGGAREDIAAAREAAVDAEGVASRILATDLVLYPYQLYQLRRAGADAVTLLVGALATRQDLVYLEKIAASLQLTVLWTVTSAVQLARVPAPCAGVVVSNRQLEDFGLDATGAQALALLRSDALRALREQSPDVLVLVEGGVGTIARAEEDGGDPLGYIRALKDAGAMGALVGRGLVSTTAMERLKELQAAVSSL